VAGRCKVTPDAVDGVVSAGDFRGSKKAILLVLEFGEFLHSQRDELKGSGEQISSALPLPTDGGHPRMGTSVP
jgi:hypothetical protein